MPMGSIFEHRGAQAVSLPVGARFPNSVKRVFVRMRGSERILSPADQGWDSFFLNSLSASDDFMAVRSGQDQGGRESF